MVVTGFFAQCNALPTCSIELILRCNVLELLRKVSEKEWLFICLFSYTWSLT